MKYAVRLEPEQQALLKGLLNAGVAPARKLTHARILLKADQHGPALRDQEIARQLEICAHTVFRVRKRFVDSGLDAALSHLHPQNLKPHLLDESAQAHLIALACTKEKGQPRLSLRLLADKMVELGYAAHLSHETVRKTLKKTTSSRI
jgi:hypothetical protein